MARNGRIYDCEWNAKALKFIPLNEKATYQEFMDRWSTSKVGIVITAYWQYERSGYQTKLIDLLSALEFIPPCDVIVVVGGFSLSADGEEKFSVIRSFVDSMLSGNSESVVIYDENGAYDAMYPTEYFSLAGSKDASGMSDGALLTNWTSPVYRGPYNIIPKCMATASWEGNANRIRQRLFSHPFMGGGHRAVREGGEKTEHLLIDMLSMGRLNADDMHLDCKIEDLFEEIEFKAEPDVMDSKIRSARNELVSILAINSERAREPLVQMPDSVNPAIAEIERSLDAMNDIMDLWESALAKVPFSLSIVKEKKSKASYRLSAFAFGSIYGADDAEVPEYDVAATHAIGRALGMDIMIDAYLSGVPKSDVIA